MSLSSIHFIFIFLPAALFFYYILPFSNWKNGILVFFSLLFFSWADLTNLPILVLSVFVNYGFSLLIGHFKKTNKTKASRVTMWIGVFANLSLLIFYKYLGFFIHTISTILPVNMELREQILPLGISYFTFTGISYILDTYFGFEKPEKNILRFSVYMIMFPKLLQGPITRYKEIKETLSKSNFVLDNLLEGARRFILGLSKKVIIADSLAIVAHRVFDGNLNRLGADLAWYGLIAYTLQIYFDFAGYTDMAIGLGRMFGYKLPENFNFPYVCRSVADFWRRWHLSLTAWFRNYVFIPLEFARKKTKHLRQPSNIFIVFLLTGLWHGASWNFIIWGGYFGLILGIESGRFGKWLKKTPIVFQHFYSIIIVMFGWMFFRLTNLNDWGPFIQALFGKNGWIGVENLRTLNVLKFFPILIFGIILSLPIFSNLIKKLNQNHEFTKLVMDVVYVSLFIISVAYILSNGFTSFMYAQF